MNTSLPLADELIASGSPVIVLSGYDSNRLRHQFADAMDLLRADHLSRQDELEGAALTDQPRQPLRSPTTRKASERNLRLAKFRTFHCDADGAGHRGLAAAAERKTVDSRDHWFAEILD
jgi:hypothetical protein